MVSVPGEVLLDLEAPVGGTADEIDPGAGVDRRDALLGEGEVVGAEERSLFRRRVGLQRAALLGGRGLHVIVEIGVPEADDHQVLRPAVDVHGVDVDDAGRAVELVDWVEGVVGGAEEALLFGGDEHEEDGPLGGSSDFGESAGDFEDAGAAARVVDGPVVDLVAVDGGPIPKWSQWAV